MSTENLMLKNPERWSVPHQIDESKLRAAADAACAKLKRLILRDGRDFPNSCSEGFKYPHLRNDNWVAGLYTGSIWLAYLLTGDEFFRDVALSQIETYRERFDCGRYIDSHDAGFVYIPSCVAAYKLFGNEEAEKIAMDILEYYYTHCYSFDGKFIIRNNKKAKEGVFESYRTMMDSMLNAPLLFWATEHTGDKKYAEAALGHVKTTADYLVREDGSTFHHYQFDPETSKPLYGLTWQGNSDSSCWSRGHAWGIYGFPIAYSYKKEPFVKEAHRKIAYFMLNRLPEDCIPYWDYDFVEGDEPRDASAAAISACGFLEMAKMTDDSDPDKVIFESAAAQLLEAVIDNCTGDIGVDYDGLICHVTHAKPQGQGIDECAPYGDYFYLEALARYLLPDFVRFW